MSCPLCGVFNPELHACVREDCPKRIVEQPHSTVLSKPDEVLVVQGDGVGSILVARKHVYCELCGSSFYEGDQCEYKLCLEVRKLREQVEALQKIVSVIGSGRRDL